MANPSKRVGTEGENRAVELLSGLGGSVRVGGNAASNDVFVSTLPDVPFEVKRQATLRVPEWTRLMVERHGPRSGLVLIPRDRRRRDAMPESILFPMEFAIELLRAYITHKDGQE